MESFDENIVREYFELNGFFVRQLGKHAVRKRKKTEGSGVELLVYNPSAPADAPEPNFQLFSSDMSSVRQAIVVVHGTFSPAKEQCSMVRTPASTAFWIPSVPWQCAATSRPFSLARATSPAS